MLSKTGRQIDCIGRCEIGEKEIGLGRERQPKGQKRPVNTKVNALISKEFLILGEISGSMQWQFWTNETVRRSENETVRPKLSQLSLSQSTFSTTYFLKSKFCARDAI